MAISSATPDSDLNMKSNG